MALDLKVQTLAYRKAKGTQVGFQLQGDGHWVSRHNNMFNKEKYYENLVTRKGFRD